MAAAGSVSRTEHLMGTVFTIAVYDDEFDPSVVEEAFDWLRAVEATFSTFHPDSEISRIGRGELDPDQAAGDVRHVLSMCDEIEIATERRFSIRPGRPGGPGLDPAGFVKGWSVDEAALILRMSGIRRFIIDAGGDVACVGEAPYCGRWRIGIRDPEEPDRVAIVLKIREGAAATSGTYFRPGHIWGTSTGDSVTSVTVVGPSLGTADALATAIYGDQASSLAFMSRFPGYAVLLMTSDREMRWAVPAVGGECPVTSAPLQVA